MDPLTIQPRYSPKAVKRFRKMDAKALAEEELRNYGFERDLEFEIDSELLTVTEGQPSGGRKYAGFLAGVLEEHRRRVTRMGDVYQGDDPEIEEDY